MSMENKNNEKIDTLKEVIWFLLPVIVGMALIIALKYYGTK